MIWATDRPTKPGWYWYHHNKNFQAGIVQLFVMKDGRVEIQGLPFNWQLEQLTGKWAGPIPEPKEPEHIRDWCSYCQQPADNHVRYFSGCGTYMGWHCRPFTWWEEFKRWVRVQCAQAHVSGGGNDPDAG